MYISKYVETFILLAIMVSVSFGGPYSKPLQTDMAIDMVPDPGIEFQSSSNNIFSQWASSCISYLPVGIVDPQWRLTNNALGPATGDHFDICSLGDLSPSDIASGRVPGEIVLGFNQPVSNRPGPDFAVFENGIIYENDNSNKKIFAELAFVEVSTDGITFVRFPSVSLNNPETNIGSYDSMDVTNVYNLAGKHKNSNGTSLGTPFDLNDLLNMPEVLNGSVDLSEINYIRLVDIPGNDQYSDNATMLADISTIDPETGNFEYYSSNHNIRDPWWTFGSGGFDLEAVGVLNLTNGDGNADGIVDINDLHILLDHWLEPAFWYYGDFNQDGIVNIADIAILLKNWMK